MREEESGVGGGRKEERGLLELGFKTKFIQSHRDSPTIQTEKKVMNSNTCLPSDPQTSIEFSTIVPIIAKRSTSKLCIAFNCPIF